MLVLSIFTQTICVFFGLIGLVVCLLIMYGNLIDWNPFNAHLHDNREDKLSDWVRQQKREKAKERKESFWNRIFGDPDADWLLQQELNRLNVEDQDDNKRIRVSRSDNYYDRNELKSVEDIIVGSTKGEGHYMQVYGRGVRSRQIFDAIRESLPEGEQLPIVVVDEAHKHDPETINRIIAEHSTPPLRQPYERYAGEFKEKLENRTRIIPAWVTEEQGDGFNPLNHEQSK